MNLFSAQGEPQEFKGIRYFSAPIVLPEKYCSACREIFPIDRFYVHQVRKNRKGQLVEYRDSSCKKCRGKRNMATPSRNSEEWRNYQIEYHKNYQRKKPSINES